MSLVADALQPLLPKGLATLGHRTPDMSLPDLIGKQKTIGYDLSFNDTAQSMLTDFRDTDVVVGAMTWDSARFATAAFQSIASVSQSILGRDGVAWSLVQSYYAAFYAGHSLIRLLGESCSYFDRQHVTRIAALAGAAGQAPRFKLEAGVHRCILSASATAVESVRLRSGTGGTHEVFWNVFGQRIRRAGEDVLRGALARYESQLVFGKVDALVQSICSHGSPLHCWLSVVRNEVQYRHSLGVWFPCTVRRQDRERLGRLIGQWTRDPMNVDIGATQVGLLGEFVAACAFIVAMCRTMWLRIAERGRITSLLSPVICLRQAGYA